MTSQTKNILFYYPSNKRTIAMETLLMELNSRPGYRVIGLTTCSRGDLHEFLESNGISVFSHVVKDNPRWLYYIKQIWFLVSFCKKQEIHFLHTHLQQVNIIAVIAQFFIRAKLIVFRHHFHYDDNAVETDKVSRMQKFFDRVINKLSRVIVVPSSGVKAGMLQHENVRENKIHVIPYIYDFTKYNSPDNRAVSEIKNQFAAHLLLIMVSRLVNAKRHHIVFPIIKDLVDEGFDIKLLVLDEGSEEQALKEWIDRHNMSKFIFMLGFKRDFINYMAASDMLIQPSLTDASNSVAKEMAMLEKIILVTDQVGDYSDYVRDNENGFLLPIVEPQARIKEIIMKVYNNKDQYKKMGVQLRKDVLGLFDVQNGQRIINDYFNLMK